MEGGIWRLWSALSLPRGHWGLRCLNGLTVPQRRDQWGESPPGIELDTPAPHSDVFGASVHLLLVWGQWRMK